MKIVITAVCLLMSESFSIVTLHWPSHGHFLIEWGAPTRKPVRTTEAHEPARHLYTFEPGSLVGYSRRLENHYGSIRWDYFALHLSPEGTIDVPGVEPLCDVLFHMRGKARFNRARRWISRLHGEQLDPTELPPDFHRRSGLRLHAGVSMSPLLREAKGGPRG
jgi:hypothetical protein